MAQTMIGSTFSKLSQMVSIGLARKNTTAVYAIVREFKYSTTVNECENKSSDHPAVRRSVFISQSSDVFTNLALEDWLYKNFDFKNHQVLMLWRNAPTVVIGRHQNPWLEANLANMSMQGMEIARRNSGGGTVYHDRGNINMTFFTTRESYNRRNNLELITRALFRECGIQTEISSREDIVAGGCYKQISGTASKLGRPNAYHHCTLLVDVNKVALKQSLLKQEKGITTNATQSVPAPIMNLCELNPHVTVEKLLGAIGYEYLRTCPISGEDGGQDLINKQRGFQMVNPTNNWFPGLDKLKEEFQSWSWRFGKTPKFQVTRSFKVPHHLMGEGSSSDQELKITLTVSKGIIEEITLMVPQGFKAANGFHGEARVITTLRGKRFSEEAVISLENSLSDMGLEESMSEEITNENEFVVNCMREVMMAV